MNEFYYEVLKEELILALGCTDPTTFAICAHKAKEVLGKMPEKIEVYASGNLIKNVKGVFIPNTPKLRGIEIATILGTLIETSDNTLAILENVSTDLIQKAKELNSRNICKVYKMDTTLKLAARVVMYSEDDKVEVEITNMHDNISKIVKNDNVIFEKEVFNQNNDKIVDSMSITSIFDFVVNMDIMLVKDLLDRQIKNNMEIAKEGLSGVYGLNVGKSLLENSNSIYDKMKAYAAAGSDARMSGCDKAVIINCGSGNQGMCIAIPLAVYKEEFKISEDDFYRALSLANLIPVHIKANIGRLSAYCGASSASMGVGAALSYLKTKNLKVIEDTITNNIATITGIVCDGAKPSCALKIATCLDASFTAHLLALKGKVVENNTGIIGINIEKSISNMSEIARDGMDKTDDKILEIMIR